MQTVLQSLKGQRLGNAATNPPRSDELLEHLQTIPEIGRNSEILKWMESTIIQTSSQGNKGIAPQKERGKQGRLPSSFYQQATSQPTSPRRAKEKEKEPEETIFAPLQDSMESIFNIPEPLWN
ncbi:hypothetical protein O181_005630 [Austropuccinia psidii MF-1]|uniref:Uncharacterized protein n=1 Tax=Austropuccinia psidii MF-1 TaxID=1389203 RepID=A0A9Q3BJC2_9BASI|nr:hypothetical protein [Austropuccinia psidii MF-1]